MHKTAKRLGLMQGAIFRNDDVMRRDYNDAERTMIAAGDLEGAKRAWEKRHAGAGIVKLDGV